MSVSDQFGDFVDKQLQSLRNVLLAEHNVLVLNAVARKDLANSRSQSPEPPRHVFDLTTDSGMRKTDCSEGDLDTEVYSEVLSRQLSEQDERRNSGTQVRPGIPGAMFSVSAKNSIEKDSSAKEVAAGFHHRNSKDSCDDKTSIAVPVLPGAISDIVTAQPEGSKGVDDALEDYGTSHKERTEEPWAGDRIVAAASERSERIAAPAQNFKHQLSTNSARRNHRIHTPAPSKLLSVPVNSLLYGSADPEQTQTDTQPRSTCSHEKRRLSSQIEEVVNPSTSAINHSTSGIFPSTSGMYTSQDNGGKSSNGVTSGYSSEGSSRRNSGTSDTLNMPQINSADHSYQVSFMVAADSSASAAAGEDMPMFKLIKGWTHNSGSSLLSSTIKHLSNIGSNEMDDDDVVRKTDRYARYMLHPNASVRLGWDWLSVLLTIYDAFALPLQFVEMEDNEFTIAMLWITRIFWSFDVILSFTTGFTTFMGNLEFRPRKICNHYARTWFPFDFALVALDWCQQFLSEVVASSLRMTRGGKLIRIVRLIRIMRLIRIARIAQVLETKFENQNVSEKFGIIFETSRALLAIIALMHLIGCVWYAVGAAGKRGWVHTQGANKLDFWSRYSRSLLWSTGIFTGAIDAVAENEEERIFIIIVLVFSFVVASYFVSSFTSSMTQLHLINDASKAQFLVLRRYMKQHNIDPKLCMRITRNARHVLNQKQVKTPEEDVELLQLISEPLRVDLHYEVHNAQLVTHPLLHHFGQVDMTAMKKVCHLAVNSLTFSKGDVLFSPGEIPPHPQLFLLSTGICVYDFQDTSGKHHKTRVRTSTWICEPALWVVWIFRGLLRAEDDIQVLVINGAILMEISVRSHTINFATYGRLYVDMLNHVRQECTDLADHIDVHKVLEKACARGGLRGSIGRVSILSIADNLKKVLNFADAET